MSMPWLTDDKRLDNEEQSIFNLYHGLAGRRTLAHATRKLYLRLLRCLEDADELLRLLNLFVLDKKP